MKLVYRLLNLSLLCLIFYHFSVELLPLDKKTEFFLTVRFPLFLLLWNLETKLPSESSNNTKINTS